VIGLLSGSVFTNMTNAFFDGITLADLTRKP